MFKINQTTVLRYLSLLYSAISIFIIGHSNSIEFSLLVFSSASFFVLAAHAERDFSNPVALFVTFYYAYSTWFSYHALIVGEYDVVLVVESIHLAAIGLSSLVLGSLLVRTKEPLAAPSKTGARLFLPRGFVAAVEILSISSGVLVLTASAEAILSGYATKRDLLDNMTSIRALAGYASVVLAAGVLLSVAALSLSSSRQKLMLVAVFGVGVLAISFLVLGERDHLFRVVIGLLILFYMERKSANTFHYVALLALVAFLLPFTQEAKGLFISAAGGEWSISFDQIFGGEFISAGRNLYMILFHGVEFRPSVLFTEFARGLLPISGGLGFQSAGAWYDQVYRVEHGFSGTSGWGFSLVALGYMAGGGFAIAALFVAIGVGLTLLHRFRGVSPYWAVFYILAICSAVYCIRADLANLLSQVFKIGGTSLIVFFVLQMFLNFSVSDRKSSEVALSK